MSILQDEEGRGLATGAMFSVSNGLKAAAKFNIQFFKNQEPDIHLIFQRIYLVLTNYEVSNSLSSTVLKRSILNYSN